MTDSKKLNSTLMSMQLPPLGIRHLVPTFFERNPW